MDTTPLRRVTSRDGTSIAYERSGTGPALVLVGGAFCDRSFAGPLPGLLQDDFTVVTYDRRGRGDSGDTPPYAVDREVEDLTAVIEAVGGSAYAYGVSSGATLVVEAAVRGAPIRKLALVETPLTAGRPEPIENLAGRFSELCAAGRRGDVVALFMRKSALQPQEAVDQMRQMPMWPALEAIAHTVAYDAEIVGDGEVPAGVASLTAPTLGIGSAGSPDWLREGVRAITDAAPNGEYVVVDGAFHQPDSEAVAKELKRFLLS
jgi:pimeloyl-ACP methyl ester carboxylesterase